MSLRSIPVVLLATAAMLWPVPAAADHSVDVHSPNMRVLTTFSEAANGTDMAFWGPMAVLGNYDGPGGFRLVDISDPRAPSLIGQLVCPGPQSDVSIWRDLVFVSVDSPRESPECGAGGGSAWEGIRVVSIADRANPQQIAAVATDCGSHTHTLVPDLRYRDPDTGLRAPRVLLYVLSYPLGAPTLSCNQASHRKISVVEVPLRDPASASVITTPSVTPAIGCHDVTVYPAVDLAGAACITEAQIWDISDPANPQVLSHIVNPAINIHHSTTLSWDARTLVIGDELGGAAASPGCESGGEAPTGALWFYDISDPQAPQERGFFVIPQNEEGNPCTAHNFNTVPLRGERDVLVSAWYKGGTTVVDFTNPASPRQLGHYKVLEGTPSNAWSSYWYNGHIYVNNFGSRSRGMDVLEFRTPGYRTPIELPRLNPQTMELVPPH